MKNYWEIKGFCYWEKEISKDKNGNVWINVGWHLPLCSHNNNIQELLAISGYEYARNFN